MKRKNRIIWIISLLIIFTITALGLSFGPLALAKNFAESKYDNLDKSKTIIKKWDLSKPEIVVFKKENLANTAYFITLERKNLVGWDIYSTSFQQVANDNNPEASLNQLYEDVKNNKITEGNNMRSTEINLEDDNITDDSKDLTLDSPTLFELSDSSGNTKVLVQRDGDNHNQLIINGKKIDQIKNLVSPTITPDGKYIFYSKYSVPENPQEDPSSPDTPTVYSNKVYKFDIAANKEEEFFSFPPNSFTFNFKANNNLLLYSLDNNKIGTINLQTSEDKTKTIGDNQVVGEVITMEDKLGYIKISSDDDNFLTKSKTLKVDLQTLDTQTID